MWFEIAVAAVLLLVGQITFAHFERETPRWRVLTKQALGIVFFVSVSYFFGRFWFYPALVAATLPAIIIHVWWLPKHGINGRTGEPQDKYYELRGWKKIEYLTFSALHLINRKSETFFFARII